MISLDFSNFQDLLKAFGALGGVGALIAVVVNILKTVGWVKDGQAPTVSTGLNLVGLILLFAVGVLKPDADVTGADRLAGDLAFVLTTVFGFVWQLVSARLTHQMALAGIAVIGKSYTMEKDRAAKDRAYPYEQMHRE